ncbi:MAG: hypothetical protein LDL33_15760 [Desulfomonile sp.]|nr:hypothetical protein [Desulfomonile sp.]
MNNQTQILTDQIRSLLIVLEKMLPGVVRASGVDNREQWINEVRETAVSAMTIIKPAEVAKRLDRSVRWVYAHAAELGGVRIGKAVFFTTEGLENAFQKQIAEGLARPSQVGRQGLPGRFRNTGRGRRMGGKKTPGTGAGDACPEPDRHGLARILKQVS